LDSGQTKQRRSDPKKTLPSSNNRNLYNFYDFAESKNGLKTMKKVLVLLTQKALSSSRSRSRTPDKEYDSKKINADSDPAKQ
jgi:hypothetical protein